MRTRGNVSSTTCPHYLPLFRGQELGNMKLLLKLSAPHPTHLYWPSAGGAIRTPLTPATCNPRVLTPLLSNSNVIVLIIQRLPENLFQIVQQVTR